MLTHCSEKFVVSGKDPVVELAYCISEFCSVEVVLVKEVMMMTTESNVRWHTTSYSIQALELHGNYNNDEVIVSYKTDFSNVCGNIGSTDQSERCPYCDCKIDSTKTHCASCGAPC